MTVEAYDKTCSPPHMKNKTRARRAQSTRLIECGAMKLPPDVQFDAKLRLFIWRPHGLINESAVNKIITILGEMEASSAEPFNRFKDTSAAEAADLNFKYIFHVSFSAPYLLRSAIKSAILATTETHLHYRKLHAILTQG